MDKVKFALAGFGRFGRHHANVLASHPAVGSVIAGATKPEQVISNAESAGWVLTAEERADVDAIAKP